MSSAESSGRAQSSAHPPRPAPSPYLTWYTSDYRGAPCEGLTREGLLSTVDIADTHTPGVLLGSTFADRVRREFAWMKHPLDGMSSSDYHVFGDTTPHVKLVPVTELSVSPELVAMLGEWRDQHQYAYPTRFKITTDGTTRWLSQAVLGNADRLLFLVTDANEFPLGHIGLLVRTDRPRTVELDNVLRGRQVVPGAMQAATALLELWAYDYLGATHMVLRVLGSNHHAITFYESMGYSHCGELPLAESREEHLVRLVPAESAADAVDSFVEMEKDLTAVPRASEIVLTAGPSIGPRELVYVSDAVKWGWNNRHSDYVRAFEQAFADYVGAKHAIATSSCTGALHLSLLGLGIGPGDEVIVPDLTWVATASAVAYVGATPVFVDIDPGSWTIDPQSVERAITKRTKAIVPVHLYGFPADMTSLMAIADQHGVSVLEDAAPAIGALHQGKPVGTFGDIACFSFQGAKMLVTGEGGMVVTNQDELATRVRKISEHGRRPGTFWIDQLGIKYKMPNIVAALGLAQVERADRHLEAKRDLAKWYRDDLSGLEGISFQEALTGDSSIYWMTSVALDSWPTMRDRVAAGLRERGIETRPVFPAISAFPMWNLETQPVNSTAQRVSQSALNLPSGVRLTHADISRIARALKAAIHASHRD